jgi:hypothetical protein
VPFKHGRGELTAAARIPCRGHPSDAYIGAIVDLARDLAEPLQFAAGRGTAARAANATEKAREAYGRLLEIAEGAETERPEVREAREFRTGQH